MLTYDFPDRVWNPNRTPPGSSYEADAIVIGTGAGGAVAACELTLAGLDVIMLEEGDYFSAKDYGNTTPLEAVRMLYRKSGFTFTTGNAPVLLPAGKCVGGTTVINAGASLRALPHAVDRWRSEFGLDDLVRHLERTYARIEDALHIGPVRHELLGHHGTLFQKGTIRAGYTGSVMHRAERGCCGSGRCFLGCPRDAKQAMNVSYVPRALHAGARLYTRTRARRIIIEKGRAVGVRTNRGLVFRAPIVIVAAGAMYTPLLLRGTGLRGRGLGRHLKIHPAVRAIGLFDEEIRHWEGVPLSYHVESTLDRGISIEGATLPPTLMAPSLPDFGQTLGDTMEKYNRLLTLGVRTIEDTEGRIFPNFSSWPMLWYWLKRSDIDRLRDGVAVAAEILFAAGASQVYTGHRGFEILRSMTDVRQLQRERFGAADSELTAYHAQGTARMADSPEKGVADPWGEVWGVKGLYVADASAMPSTPIVNPQLSIMAFATHVARGIANRLGKRLASDGILDTGNSKLQEVLPPSS